MARCPASEAESRLGADTVFGFLREVRRRTGLAGGSRSGVGDDGERVMATGRRSVITGEAAERGAGSGELVKRKA